MELNPALPASWRLLESLYRMVGRPEDARVAGQHVATLAKLPVEVVTARSMVADGNLREAEEVIRQYLRSAPRDIEAMRVLAMIAQKNEFSKDATILLEAVLAGRAGLSPGPPRLRARADGRCTGYKEAREQIEMLIQLEPARFANRVTLASILVGLGETREAIELYRQLLREQPGDPEINLSLGHALKTEGLRRDSEEAYRAAARLRPNFGDAYWSLANLKTYRFQR